MREVAVACFYERRAEYRERDPKRGLTAKSDFQPFAQERRLALAGEAEVRCHPRDKRFVRDGLTRQGAAGSEDGDPPGRMAVGYAD